MIQKILFSNFFSFIDETEISFEMNKKSSTSLFDMNYNDQRINKVIAVVGSNGSGKTNALKPLTFVSWFITNSHNELKPNDKIPFKTHSLYKNENSNFTIFFIIDNMEYKYNLVINDNKVLLESLYQKTSTQYSYIFIRERNKDNETYSFKKNKFDISKNNAITIKDNSSLLSSAYMQNSQDAKKFVDFFTDKFISNVSVVGRHHYEESHLFQSAEFFFNNKELSHKMNKIICELDLGVSEVTIKKFENIQTDEIEVSYLPFATHIKENGDQFIMSFLEESSGTKSLFVLLENILPILENGGIAVLDEIDNDLHPHMLPVLLNLFKNEELNNKNAQIIFSCHTPEILNILMKHQIYLTEKNDLESDLYRLNEIDGLRSDDNLYAKYQSGALGAIPNI